ncbi:MAG: DNA repair ATPase, partial [Acidobacteria bacterium]|nr:DNA repair ATPase [Acidobacteriota bacterium]
ETVGGDLTVKVEDNTEDGLGIYREPVKDPNQALDDAEVRYAKLGILILIKIRPYREEEWRYLVFNTRTQAVTRIDAIGQSCVQLPEDHGIIFPGGYYLQSGETKSFAADVEGLHIKRRIRSANGEDVLYLFYHLEQGRFVMLPYNMIRKEVANPIECHGFSLFPDGRMVVFRVTTEEPTRVHPMQIWQTPFGSAELAAAPSTGSYLEKIGNAELVRGISDAFSLTSAIEDQQPNLKTYEDLIAATVRVMDSYHWLGRSEVGDLLSTLKEVHGTAELIVDEFEKVESIRRQANEAVKEAEERIQHLLRDLQPESWSSVDRFVQGLSDLRRQQGHLITLKELRYADLGRIGELETRVTEAFDSLSRDTVDFLMGEEALSPYHAAVGELEERIPAITKVSEAKPVREDLEGLGEQLDLLADVVSGLAIDDATVRTRILEGISEVLGGLNRVRALLENRRKGLLSKEATAEFGVQFKLFGQSVTSALSLADTPDRCDDQLAKLMLQLEDLESRFSEFDEYLEQLATQREEVYEAFAARKQRLLDERQRRVDQLVEAAERILKGLARRTAGMAGEDELNTFFASDAMVVRLRDLAGRLRGLEAGVQADEVESRLKAAKEDAARGLRDRKDLFEEGAAVLKLGAHRFTVNTREVDLTLVPRGSGEAAALHLHLTGTDFYQAIEEAELSASRDFWQQRLVSETDEVYRGEFL